MKLSLISIFVFYWSSIMAQSIDFSSAISSNRFFEFENQQSFRYDSAYKSGIGYSLQAGISNIMIGTAPVRFAITVDHYQGSVFSSYQALGGRNTTNAQVKKTTIGLGFYPVNFHISKNLHFALGAELSYLINDRTSGNQLINLMGENDKNIDLSQNSKNFHNDIIVGMSALLSYDIAEWKSWRIRPQYRFYMGITEEFQLPNASVRSMRHHLGLSLIRNMH
jgi:hypothetical protein